MESTNSERTYDYKKVVELRKLCAQRKIKNYTNLRKSEIITRLKQYDNDHGDKIKPKITNWGLNSTEFYEQLRVGLERPFDYLKNIYATKIQKWYRLNRHRKKNTIKFVNDKCAFTLETLSRWCYRFVHVVSENQIFQFDPDLLADYMLASGKFNNPFTRTPFNSIELLRLTKLIQSQPHNEQKWKNINLVTMKTSIQRQRQQEQEHFDTLYFLQNECLIAFDCILAMGRQNTELNVEFLFVICEELIVIFFAHVNNLFSFNREHAEQLMNNCAHQIETLELRGGPLRLFYRQVRFLFNHYIVGRFHMPHLENNH